VREPAPPTDAAAAYFTVVNSTDRPDRLVSVQSGAGQEASLHSTDGGRMSAMTEGAVIAPHGRLVLSVGGDHVMIEKLIGTLRPGQQVNLQLTFANAGVISVSAPVVALGAPAPTAGTPQPAPAGSAHEHGGDR
jgi:copper(I)-binding protein